MDTKINLYMSYIRNDYISYLKTFDSRVQHNYEKRNNQKPYVGVVLCIGGRNYFAPMTSPKKKHLRLLDSDPTTFKIKHKGRFIASVLLNNMIPVKDSDIIKLSIQDIKDRKYRDLLSNELRVIRSHQSELEAKALFLYNSVVKRRNKYFIRLSCNFKRLEEACDIYEYVD